MFILKIIQHYPLVCTIIIVTVWINYRCRKTRQNTDTANASLWARESKANSTRRKNIDNLDYITIDEKILPLIDTNDETINSCKNSIIAMKDKKILNLSGISNADLKLEYGAANLNLLSEYDENYTTLCRLLNTLGQRLYETGCPAEARKVLEFAVSTGSDMNSTYKTLCSIYIEAGEPELIDNLIDKAGDINTLSGNIILNTLQEIKKSGTV